MAKQSEDNGAEFFIKLEDPSEFRRNLLENNRDVIRILERNEFLRALRVQKVKYMSNLKNVIKDVQGMLDDIREHMPKAYVKKSRGPKPTLKMKPAPTAGGDLDSLESELKNIQSKLNIIG